MYKQKRIKTTITTIIIRRKHGCREEAHILGCCTTVLNTIATVLQRCLATPLCTSRCGGRTTRIKPFHFGSSLINPLLRKAYMSWVIERQKQNGKMKYFMFIKTCIYIYIYEKNTNVAATLFPDDVRLKGHSGAQFVTSLSKLFPPSCAFVSHYVL